MKILMKWLRVWILMPVAGFLPGVSLAQQLDLFQAVDLTPQDRGTGEAAVTEPAFTLKGIGRFGDSYQVSLESRDGNLVASSWSSGQSVNIAGFPGYSVERVEGRNVYLRIPAGESCIESALLGVSCAAGEVAVLSLTTTSLQALPSGDTTTPSSVTGASGNGGTLSFGVDADEFREIQEQLTQGRRGRGNQRQLIEDLAERNGIDLDEIRANGDVVFRAVREGDQVLISIGNDIEDDDQSDVITTRLQGRGGPFQQ